MQLRQSKEELERKLAQEKARERYNELYLLVGRSGQGKGYSERVIAWRERLQNDMREMARNGDTIGAIEKYVLRKIHDEEEGSIR